MNWAAATWLSDKLFALRSCQQYWYNINILPCPKLKGQLMHFNPINYISGILHIYLYMLDFFYQRLNCKQTTNYPPKKGNTVYIYLQIQRVSWVYSSSTAWFKTFFSHYNFFKQRVPYSVFINYFTLWLGLCNKGIPWSNWETFQYVIFKLVRRPGIL